MVKSSIRGYSSGELLIVLACDRYSVFEFHAGFHRLDAFEAANALQMLDGNVTRRPERLRGRA